MEHQEEVSKYEDKVTCVILRYAYTLVAALALSLL